MTFEFPVEKFDNISKTHAFIKFHVLRIQRPNLNTLNVFTPYISRPVHLSLR